MCDRSQLTHPKVSFQQTALNVRSHADAGRSQQRARLEISGQGYTSMGTPELPPHSPDQLDTSQLGAG